MSIKKTIRVGLGLALMALATAGNALAWWNDDWSERRQLTVDAGAAGLSGDPGAEVPVLVRLHTGNFDFQAAKPDGSDIRFVSGDDKTQLKHAVEVYDAVEELALVWVKLPKLGEPVFLYYGNAKAAKAEDAGGVYDKATVAVYHFGEAEGLPQDATAYGNNAASSGAGLGLPGVIGRGAAFSGAKPLQIESTPSLDLTGGFTFAAWVKLGAPMAGAVLLERREGDSAITIGIDGTRLFGRIENAGEQNILSSAGATLTAGQWHHVAVTSEHKGKSVIYIDGKAVYNLDLAPSLPNLSGPLTIGGGSGASFVGELDEVTLASVVRPAAYIAAVHASQMPQAKLVSVGEAQANEGGGQSMANLGVVVRELTGAAWALIGLLMAMLIWSIYIFIDKTMLLRAMTSDNERFRELLKEHGDDPLKVSATADCCEASPLNRIFLEARAYLTRRSQSRGFNGRLNRSALRGFQVEMDRAVLNEMQEMNSKLGVLTIGIAGGPFLGLLGTVWGVMDTFAAMAMSGEANIMAIAPGIASALACTLAGLILAIPALFAYNYLAQRIKDLTAQIYIFVDELGATVEDVYGEHQPESLGREAVA